MTIKRLLRKVGGGGGEILQRAIVCFLRQFHLNNKYILFTTKKANKNKVNLNYCFDFKNLGDNISPVIVQFVANQKNVDVNKSVDETKHLYAIGSIITAGCQDCTIWGSGLLNTEILYRLKGRSLDVRAVRGPLTRILLLERGIDVPECYGDPAILMPLIYNPEIKTKYKVGLITHFNEGKESLKDDRVHFIDIKTDDYKKFICEIKSCELIISSSLHGIIFAESYNIPAVLLKPNVDLFKYYDYYYSTERYHFNIATSIDEAIKFPLQPIPDFTDMRDALIRAFPIDLWN